MGKKPKDRAEVDEGAEPSEQDASSELDMGGGSPKIVDRTKLSFEVASQDVAANPLAPDSPLTPASPRVPGGYSVPLSEDELKDLTFAFQAIDINDSGFLEVKELKAMLGVLTTAEVVATEKVKQLVASVKAEFRAWLERADDDAVMPDSMQAVGRQEAAGEHGDTRHGGKRHHAELEITKNKKKKKKQEEKEPEGQQEAKKAEKKHKRRKKKDVMKDLQDSRMSFEEFVHMMGTTLLQESLPGVDVDWHKTAKRMRAYRNAFDIADVEGSDVVDFQELQMVVIALHPSHSLTHQDLVYLWEVLTRRYLKNNPNAIEEIKAKKEAAEQAEKERKANASLAEKLADSVMDTASLIVSDAGTALEHAVEAVGEGLGIAVEDDEDGEADSDFDGWGLTLSFKLFLQGMADVQRDERAANWLDLDQPNKWELLSLIIDTPVSRSEHHEVLQGLSGATTVAFAHPALLAAIPSALHSAFSP